MQKPLAFPEDYFSYQRRSLLCCWKGDSFQKIIVAIQALERAKTVIGCNYAWIVEAGTSNDWENLARAFEPQLGFLKERGWDERAAEAALFHTLQDELLKNTLLAYLPSANSLTPDQTIDALFGACAPK